MFIMVYVAVMGLYGATTGALPNVSNTVDQITGNWPVISTANCSFSAQGPAGSCNILDTWGLGLIWIFASIGSVFFRIGGIFYLMIQLIGVLAVPTGIPVVGEIFIGFVVILALYAWSTLRANHPAQ